MIRIFGIVFSLFKRALKDGNIYESLRRPVLSVVCACFSTLALDSMTL